MPLFSGGEKAGEFSSAGADMRLVLFYKEPLSQARQLAWSLDKWLHCGVWEADEGGVQGSLWGTQQAQYVFILRQSWPICELTPIPGHLDL